MGADTAATLAHIRSDAGGGSQRGLFAVGFCMGGRISFNQAWRDRRTSTGVIGFYGGPQGSRSRTTITAPVKLAPHYRCPVLGLFGGADDEHPTRRRSTGSERALDDAGVPNEMVVVRRRAALVLRSDVSRSTATPATTRGCGCCAFVGVPV